MRYPDFLREDGVIGFVAPSFGCNIEPYKTGFDHAQEHFRTLGHSVVLGPNCYEGRGLGISNTPQACGRELTEGYLSPASDVLISCGGGELMCEILDYVDFEKIRQGKPKWYMGYSDNTNMTFLLTTLCDTAAIYGPCAPAFGMEPWHPAIEDAYRLLRGQKFSMEGYPLWEKESIKDEEHPLEPYHVTETRIIRTFGGKEPVRFSGRLVGGCMDCMINLLGTCYDGVKDFADRYKEDGIIWFMESCDLSVLSVRRAVWQMKHAGWFDHVKGFLIGRPLCHGQEIMGLDQYRAVADVLESFRVPILMDVDLGHLPPMMPLISGSLAAVEYQEQKIRVEMALK